MSKEQRDESLQEREILSQALEKLAFDRATAEAEILSEAAQHEFKVKYEHWKRVKAREYADKTYLAILKETENEVGEMAQIAANRAIEIEAKTDNQLPSFAAPTAQLPSFKAALEEKRNQYNKMALLSDEKTLTDVEENVILSLGMAEDDEEELEAS